ncbi:MAG: sensor histidine kinase [Faecousia sp.]
MIQKLRIRFIILSMSTLLAVLLVILGGINIANYSGIVSEADRTLSALSEPPERFSKNKYPLGKEANGLLGKFFSEDRNTSRFFSVLLTLEGDVLELDLQSGTMIEPAEASDLAVKAFSKSVSHGFAGIYRFCTQSGSDGVRILFLDCGREITSFRRFLMTSIVLSALGLLLIFGIVVYFSGRIVRPFAESYEKQKQFITDAGHEIKTPLAIIQADADVLEMELGESEWLSDIQAHVKQLSSLTNDLVSLARMEEGGTPLQILEMPISDLISEAGESFQGLAQTQGKELQLTVEPMLSMEADEKAMRQLVSILLDNALKYSPEGSRIQLSLSRQGKLLKLAVSNSSLVPLPKENLDRLFERFYRADPSRNSQTGGHGIGLSIAKAIVTAHGGQIHASIGENNTLRISVTLPQKQPANIMRSQARKVP